MATTLKKICTSENIIVILHEHDLHTHMNEISNKRKIYDVTLKGAVINILLLISKFCAGIWGHSSAIMADAVHSLSDLLTDIIVLVSVKLGGKPKDKSHDYGYGKAATLSAAILGVVLFIISLAVFYYGMRNMIRSFQGTILERPSYFALIIAIVSIILKEWAYRFTIRTAHETHSFAVAANAWHHRSDSFSSIGTTIGIAGAIFLGERWRVLDPITSIIVSIFILKMALDLFFRAVAELTEASLPDAIEEEIAGIARVEGSEVNVDQILTRHIGHHIAIEISIKLPGDLTVKEAHKHALRIESQLKERFGEGTHVGVHIEPKEDL